MKILLCVCCLALLAKAAVCREGQADRTKWFAGKWGVFFHYLANMPGQRDTGMTAEQWSRQVDLFDAKGLAKQLQDVGADYFAITIGQGSGHYLAPNKVYDKLTGITPSKCSRRDLVSDLAGELNPLGMRLLVYTAADMGWGDLEARKALGFASHHNDHLVGLRKRGQPNDWRANRAGQIEFLKNSEKIHRQWSMQWGSKVAGWWVDGCYHPDIRFPDDEPPNLRTLRDAILSGNPQAIVTFNTGVRVPVAVATPYEDYTPGEISKQLPACPGAWLEKDGRKSRYHVLTYLGTSWGSGKAPRFSDERAVRFTTDVTSKGGFVSLDVPPQRNGLIPKAFLPQLKLIGGAVRRSR